MTLVNLSKFATFAFLICIMVSTFGSGAETVIKEVVRNIDGKCSKNGETCFAEKDIYCCEGFICVAPLIWPPVPGRCVGPIPQMKLFTKQPTRPLPTLGGAQVLTEEVVLKKTKMVDGEEKIRNVSPYVSTMSDEVTIRQQECAKLRGSCNPSENIECCEGLVCVQPRIWPPIPGICL